MHQIEFCGRSLCGPAGRTVKVSMLAWTQTMMYPIDFVHGRYNTLTVLHCDVVYGAVPPLTDTCMWLS